MGIAAISFFFYIRIICDYIQPIGAWRMHER